MTTAARPTFNPAVGGNRASDGNFPTQIVSAKSLPGHTKLKLRQPGQNNTEEIAKRDLKAELKKAEQDYKELKRKGKDQPLLILDEEEREGVKLLKKPKIAEEEDVLDADDSFSSDSDSSDEDSSDASSDDEDEAAELLRELEKIKKERTEEKARLEREQQEQEQMEKEKEAMSSNPLLNLDTSENANKVKDFSVKRRWDDDVVFKNQARVEEKPQKKFINDTLRSDFHRKFMTRYIK